MAKNAKKLERHAPPTNNNAKKLERKSPPMTNNTPGTKKLERSAPKVPLEVLSPKVSLDWPFGAVFDDDLEATLGSPFLALWHA